MRAAPLLLFAAAAAGLVTPDDGARQQQAILDHDDDTAHNDAHHDAVHDAVQAWWDALPAPEEALSLVDSRIANTIHQDSMDTVRFSMLNPGEDEFEHGGEYPHPKYPPHGHHPPPPPHDGPHPPPPPHYVPHPPPPHDGPHPPPPPRDGPHPPPPPHDGPHPPPPPHDGPHPPPPPPHDGPHPPPPPHDGPHPPPLDGSHPPPPPSYHPLPGRGRRPHPPRGDPTKTIYEVIKSNKQLTKFAELVDAHDDIKQLLSDPSQNLTLFVPTNHAIRRALHRPGHKKPSHPPGTTTTATSSSSSSSSEPTSPPHLHPPKEFLLALLKYHLVPGVHTLPHLHRLPTLPTNLFPAHLGGPQRLRLSTSPPVGPPLVTRINFHAWVVIPDILASNGIVHAISAPLVPPPDQTTLVRLLPKHFSTLALALERTGLRAELEGLGRENGSTFFAPTNRAWEALGPRANRFLFSEGAGEKVLRALVRYHAVVNRTVYSDAGYGVENGNETEEGEEEKGGRRRHVDLPSLLEGRELGVDVYRGWGGRVVMVVNGKVRVLVRDGVARDGVVHAVGRVLLPPRKGAEEEEEEEEEEVKWMSVEGRMSVEELTSRLEPYMEEPEKAVEEEKGGRREGNDDL